MINLLWTGGWDSTFWLAYSLLVKGYAVQPYYIVDPARKSSLIEIQRMNDIKKMIVNKSPKVAELFLNTKYHCLYDIKPNAKITNQVASLRKKIYFGGQYEWLARFADENNIESLHLCIEKEDHPTGFNYILKNHTIPFQYDGHTYHKLSPKYEISEVDFLKHFIFPIYHLTKSDMRQIGIESDFMFILDHTWFCHNPIFFSRPCGICTPCAQIMKLRMGYRLPAFSKALYFIKRVFFDQLIKSLKFLYHNMTNNRKSDTC